MNNGIRNLLLSCRAKHYDPALLPGDIKRGDVGTCFDTCIIAALECGHYDYVEGYARVYNGDWHLHAWLTDGVTAYDPTWQATDPDGNDMPVPAEYFGMAMNYRLVAEFMRVTEYQSILTNHWRDPVIAEKIFRTAKRSAALRV
jgi:hypothetical protein